MALFCPQHAVTAKLLFHFSFNVELPILEGIKHNCTVPSCTEKINLSQKVNNWIFAFNSTKPMHHYCSEHAGLAKKMLPICHETNDKYLTSENTCANPFCDKTYIPGDTTWVYAGTHPLSSHIQYQTPRNRCWTAWMSFMGFFPKYEPRQPFRSIPPPKPTSPSKRERETAPIPAPKRPVPAWYGCDEKSKSRKDGLTLDDYYN